MVWFGLVLFRAFGPSLTCIGVKFLPAFRPFSVPLFGCFATLRPFVLALARDGKADACFEDAVAALTNVKPPAEARKWVELEGAHKGWATTKRCAGRFTPKLPPSEAKVDDAKLSYAAWLAGCIDGLAAASDVEINLMTCESVHKSNCRDDADSLVDLSTGASLLYARGSSRSSRTTSRPVRTSPSALAPRRRARSSAPKFKPRKCGNSVGAWA